MREDHENGDPWDEDVVNGLAIELNAKQLGVWYTVTDEAFGAVGDDTADDTDAIQTAIDAARDAGGGTVFLPAGTYKITSALRLARNVSLLGDASDFTGSLGTRIRQVTDGEHGLYSDVSPTAGALEIRNLVIESTATTGTAHGIYLQNNSGTSTHPPFWALSLRDVMIRGFTGYGFNAESIITSVLERVNCQNNGHGFLFKGNAYGTDWSSVNTSVVLNACYANGNNGIGYNFINTVYCSLNGCAADSNGDTQYMFDTCNSITLSGCGAEYGPAETPAVGDGFVIKDVCEGISLIGCTVLNNMRYGLWVTGNSSRITVIGFRNTSDGPSAVAAMKVDPGSHVTEIGGAYGGGVLDIAAGGVLTLDDGSGGSDLERVSKFNVVAYGAVGDGVSDDTDAIQAALDAANAVTGGTVYFPPGTYEISSALVLRDRVSLVGERSSFGYGAVIRQTTPGEHGLYIETTAAFPRGVLTICNLGIESTASTGTAHGIYMRNNSVTSTHQPFISMRLHDLFVSGFTGYGVLAQGMIQGTMERVYAEGNGGGFFLNGDGYSTGWSSVNSGVTMISCTASGNTGIGFAILRTLYTNLTACTAYSNGGGQYSIDHSNTVTLNSCGAEYGASEAPATGDSFTIKGTSQAIVLTGCYEINNQHYGLWVTGNSFAVTVIGFLDNDQGSHAVAGLKVDSGSHMTDICSVWNGTKTIAANSVTTPDDGVGGSVFASTMYLNGDLHLASTKSLYCDEAKTLELSTFGNANYLGVESASATNGPDIYAHGSDTNIDIHLLPKGTGTVKVGGNPVATEVAVPSTSSSTGKAGQIAYASGFVYVCIATNTWQRAALATW